MPRYRRRMLKRRRARAAYRLRTAFNTIVSIVFSSPRPWTCGCLSNEERRACAHGTFEARAKAEAAK